MFKLELNLPNLNILFMLVFGSGLNRTPRCRFRFGLKTPEPEPNRTPASLAGTLHKHGLASGKKLIMLEDVTKQIFGYIPRSWQTKVMEKVLEGHDVVAIAANLKVDNEGSELLHLSYKCLQQIHWSCANYTVQGPGRAGSRPFFLALTLALRAGPPSAWPWPWVGLAPGQQGRARVGPGPTLTLLLQNVLTCITFFFLFS